MRCYVVLKNHIMCDGGFHFALLHSHKLLDELCMYLCLLVQRFACQILWVVISAQPFVKTKLKSLKRHIKSLRNLCEYGSKAHKHLFLVFIIAFHIRNKDSSNYWPEDCQPVRSTYQGLKNFDLQLALTFIHILHQVIWIFPQAIQTPHIILGGLSQIHKNMPKCTCRNLIYQKKIWYSGICLWGPNVCTKFMLKFIQTYANYY